MVFAVFAGFVVALVAGHYLGDSDSRVSSELTRSRFSKPKTSVFSCGIQASGYAEKRRLISST